MQRLGKELLYSPHDLIAYLEGDFASWMDRLHFESKAPEHPRIAQAGATPGSPKPDEDDEEMALLKKRGQEHEARYLAELVKQHPDLVTIDSGKAFVHTVAMMEAGRSVIYQGCLRAGPFLGYPDFLFRVSGASRFGKFGYEPADTKLAKSAKPHFIVQLCAYADMLEAVQGRLPRDFVFRLGDGADARFRTDEFFYYYRRLKRAFLAFHAAFDPTKMPEPGLERSFGRWSEYAAQLLEKSDHLSRVARITRTQIKRLEAAGISTMAALAQTGKARVSQLQPDVLSRLKVQASLQVKSRGLGKPLHQVVVPTPEDPRRGMALLPPPSKLDVFFDMEGFPLVEGGLEYLFGAVALDGGEPQYADWWAHDNVQERSAFENFVDWAHGRWKKDQTMHIYHYAAYETSALRRLMGKYASREAQVDDLLRHQVFVDLYTVVRQGVLIDTPGYSLKDVERLYMPPRQGQVVSASGSVVAYQKWLDSGESGDWRKSKILAEIRDYNRVDCESLVGLRDWLLELQEEHGIAYLPEAGPGADKGATAVATETAATVLSRTLLKQIEAGSAGDPEHSRVQELLAWLLEFHWRDAKPVFWRMFDRHEMTEQELVEDLDCLGALQRTKTPPRPDKRSWLYEYAFDPDQDTKLHEESKCFFAHDLAAHAEISRFDPNTGLLWLHLGPSVPKPPDQLGLIPDEYVSAKPVADAVLRYVAAWASGKVLSRAVDDLLHRRPPRMKGHRGGPIVDPDAELLPQLVDVVGRLERTTLCIQGPPGTGKTYASGEVIADLLKRGKRVGVTANSHKAIMKTMESVVEAMGRNGATAPLYKVGGDADDPLVTSGRVQRIESRGIASFVGADAVVVGGTAWAFSRAELEQQFDYLFIDEAGQFSLANVVAVGLSAANLVLVGDQMQLAQPVQGSHPGESGRSGLEYLLDGHDTIPPDFGVFLAATRRLHPEICRFISDAVYESRLEPHPSTAKRSLIRPKGGKGLGRTSGVVFIPVEHEGNAQCSDEEVDIISAITKELLDWRFVGPDGTSRKLSLADILLVAPYNMQVRSLQRRLGPEARVGSVDKFQGQEAPVVVVSMCASSLEDCPRGAEFLLNPNRINVAVSRAQCLAIVVGCPAIMTARCQSIEQMRLVNLFCRLVDYSDDLAATQIV